MSLVRVFDDYGGRHDRGDRGVIVYSAENLGRMILTVKWDRGGKSTCFPDDLAETEESEARKC